MTLTHGISVGGDRMFTGPAEEATHYMRTHALADRVVRDDGVVLATCQAFDRMGLLNMAYDNPGSPDRGLGVAWIRGVS